jgi:hypothetical protein
MVEHPFANLKYRIFGQRFLLHGLPGAQTEISRAAYKLKRTQNILGGHQLASALRTVRSNRDSDTILQKLKSNALEAEASLFFNP